MGPEIQDQKAELFPKAKKQKVNTTLSSGSLILTFSGVQMFLHAEVLREVLWD